MATQRPWPDPNPNAWAAGNKPIFNSAYVPWTAQPMNVQLKAPVSFQSLTNYGKPQNLGTIGNINNYLGPAANQGRGLSGNPGYAPVYVGGAGQGRGSTASYAGYVRPPTPTTPPMPSTASSTPSTGVDMTGFMSPQQAASYSPVSPDIYDPGNIFSNIPNTSFGGNALTPATASSWFGAMMGKGKKFFEENKWLTGDKETVGAIPLGLGLFNAFNQYTQGRESIKSMREQNALARESFALNKAGALASLEDQYNKRNSNDMYHRNPNLSYADNVTAASSKTLEDMKRFK